MEKTDTLNFIQIKTFDQAQWLTPIIPALWEAEAGRSRGQEIKIILANMMVKSRLKKNPDAVAHAYNPSTLGG